MQPIAFVQSMYQAFGQGDIATILANCTDDIEWTLHATVDAPYAGTFRGKEAVQRWFGHLATNDEIQAFEPREFFAGTDHVTVLGWEKARVLPKGGVFESHWVHVFQLKGGKVSRWVGMVDSAARVKAGG
jgi:uncharacterized protein